MRNPPAAKHSENYLANGVALGEIRLGLLAVYGHKQRKGPSALFNLFVTHNSTT